jgi:predicted aspartyl protease
MNISKIQIFAGNPEDEKTMTGPLEVLVNTASELTWLSATALSRIGVTPRWKEVVNAGTNQNVERNTGSVILYANGREIRAEVVFAEPGDAIIVGRKTLEGLGVTMDDPKHGFIALTTLMAFQPHEMPEVA